MNSSNIQAGFEEPDPPPALPAIPTDIRQVYDELCSEMVQAAYRWLVFRQLFAKNKERIELMGLASTFFGEVENMLIDSVFLHICRMTDPTRMGKHVNAVIGQLREGLEGIDQNAFPEVGRLIVDLDKRLADIKTKNQLIRDHRDKRISHLDKPTLLKSHDLDGVPLETIDEVLGAIGDFLNAFSRVTLNSETNFRATSGVDDGNGVIELLKRAYAFGELVSERLAAGDSTVIDRVEKGPYGVA